MLVGVVVAGRQLQALLVVQPQAQLAAQAVDVGVEQIALAGFGRDAAAARVVGGAVVARAQVQRVVQHALAAGEMLLQLAAQPVRIQPAQRADGGHGGFGHRFAAGGPGGDRDDAAGGPGAVDRAAAAQHFDALDGGRVDVGQIARRIAVGVQRNAVHQHQHAASAQRLAIVGHGAAGIGHARHGLGQHAGQAVRAGAQFLQGVALQHDGLLHGADQVAGRARGADLDRRHHGGAAAGRLGFDEGGRAFLPQPQWFALQQRGQRLLWRHGPGKRRRLHAGHGLGRIENLQPMRLGQPLERLVERLRRHVDGDGRRRLRVGHPRTERQHCRHRGHRQARGHRRALSHFLVNHSFCS
jgi:hypothetical protein